MARTIKEIKDSMTATFCKERAVIKAYGLSETKSFDEQFSPVSIESILFYAFAFAVWVLENLFEKHAKEIDGRIEQLEPHTLRWYVSKTKAFMYGKDDNGKAFALVPNTDYYDLTGVSEKTKESARIVKFANATESNTVVYLKVAGADNSGNPCQLSGSQLAALKAYIDTVKDAGVSVTVRNEPADDMIVRLVVYYNPMLLNSDGVDADGNHIVADTIRKVVTELPFNGLFRNTDLLAAVNALPAVEVVGIREIKTKAHNAQTWKTVEGYDRPYSGYYSIEEMDIDYQEYNATDNV